MEREKIRSGVIKCVAESLALEESEIRISSTLFDDLGADSLDFMDILFALEQEFQLNLQKEDFDFLSRINMAKEEATKEGILTTEAQSRLKLWLPAMPQDNEIHVRNLGKFITTESVILLVEELQKDESKKAENQ